MADLGTGYVQIVPKAQGISNSISKIITPGINEAGTSGGKALSRSLGAGIMSAGSMFTNFAATGVSAISGLTGAISAKAFGGGMSRAMGIDDAQAKFKQLGFDVTKTMDSVKASVSGTRYGLDEAAGIAVNLGSAGVEAGDSMTKALQSVASIASISGADLSHIGSIYTKVASAGKLSGDVMSQLQMNGINANAALQQALGKSGEEISKLVKDGKIDFATFSDAMKSYFGDAAESANSTFSGASANVQAALSRMGASFTSPAFGALQQIFAGTENSSGGLITAIDNVTKSMQPLIDKFTSIVTNVGGAVTTALSTFNTNFERTGSIVESIKPIIQDIIPDSLVEKFNTLSPKMQLIIADVGKVAAIVVGAAGGFGLLTGAIGALVPGLGTLIGGLGGAGGAFGIVSRIGNTLFSVISSLVGGSGFGGLLGPLQALISPAGIIIGLFGGMFATSESFRTSIMGLVTTIGSSFMNVIQTLMPIIQQLTATLIQLVTTIATAIAPIIQSLTPIIGQIITIVGNVVAMVLTSVIPMIQELMPMISEVITIIGSVISTIAEALMPVIEALMPVIQNILNVVVPVLTKIMGTVIQVVTKIIEIVTPAIKKILDVVVPILQKIFSIVSTVMEKIRGVFSKVWNAIGPIVTKAVAGIKNTIEGIKNVVQKVTTTFNKIKTAVTGPIEKARDKVKGIIDKIKGFFSFKISAPNIPLPHFGVSPEGWKFKDLLKGSIPKLKIDWYAEGGIMKQPTVFGGGEAGAEAIVPLDPFWNKMDAMAAGLNNGNSTINNFYITVEDVDNPQEFTDELIRLLNTKARMG